MLLLDIFVEEHIDSHDEPERRIAVDAAGIPTVVPEVLIILGEACTGLVAGLVEVTHTMAHPPCCCLDRCCRLWAAVVPAIPSNIAPEV